MSRQQDAHKQLGELVAELHIPPEGPDNCDVDAAYGMELYLVAAEVLRNATDVPAKLNRLYEIAFTQEKYDAEWEEYMKIPRYKCARCGTTVNCWDEYSKKCQDCGSTPPEPAEEECADE